MVVTVYKSEGAECVQKKTCSLLLLLKDNLAVLRHFSLMHTLHTHTHTHHMHTHTHHLHTHMHTHTCTNEHTHHTHTYTHTHTHTDQTHTHHMHVGTQMHKQTHNTHTLTQLLSNNGLKANAQNLSHKMTNSSIKVPTVTPLTAVYIYTVLTWPVLPR